MLNDHYRMTRISIFLILLFGLLTLISCGQNSKLPIATKFINSVNTYNSDSLQVFVADNFQLKRTYINYTNDKKEFLGIYLQQSKHFGGQYKILNATEKGNEIDFVVEDQSNYMKSLKIDFPKWKIKIKTNDKNKIASMLIDTTETYQTYLTQSKLKSKEFEKWINENYPTEYMADLYSSEGRLEPFLKEYSTRK